MPQANWKRRWRYYNEAKLAMHEKARSYKRLVFMRQSCKAFLAALCVLLVLALFVPIAWGRDAGGEGVGSTPKATSPAPVHLPAVRIPQAAHQYRLTLTREARRVWGLSAPISSFAAQIHQESGWNANARSPVGAMGLTQFMPATAAWMGQVDPVLAGGASLNPTWAIRALVVYDKWLWDRLPAAGVCERMAFTLASYNSGLGTVQKKLRAQPCAGLQCHWFDAVELSSAGQSPANHAETRGYSRRILYRFEPSYEMAGWGNGSCP